MVRSIVVVATVALSGCASMFPSVVPEASGEYKASGEVQMNRFGSTFDAVRVRSPRCNLAKRTDGSWGGQMDNRPIDVSVEGDKIRGVDIMMDKLESTPDKLIVTGQFRGKIYRFELSNEQALIRTPKVSLTLKGRQVEGETTSYGPLKELTLKGDAGLTTPPWPQIAFALLSAFQ
jgi:hypothetical protein